MVVEQKGIERVFHNHFQSIFSTSNPTTEAIEECLRDVEPRVTSSMNEELQKVSTRGGSRGCTEADSPLKVSRP